MEQTRWDAKEIIGMIRKGNEPIPHYAWLLSAEKPKEEDIKRAREFLIRKKLI
jgi:hypothetical protein